MNLRSNTRVRAGAIGPATVLIAAFMMALSGAAQAQPTFSIDIQGPTIGLVFPDDILTPVGPGIAPPPAVVIPGGAGGLGVFPGAVGAAEVDALSYGLEKPLQQQVPTPQFLEDHWFFSVDEFAVGDPNGVFPSVTTEGAFGASEASADVYQSITPPGVVPPIIGSNKGVRDGNGGLTPFAAPGNNLREPNLPTLFAVPDPGDNLDALDMDTQPNHPVYFSLDSSFFDPLEGPPINTGTALANGFVGGDVLVTPAAGGAPALYAPAITLGLDQFGTDTDDLDALVLWDNGNGVYDPVTSPYSWLGLFNPPTDMLLYSVRRGSAVIGTLDALQGLPIEEGDILVPVLSPGGFFTPGIFVPAEAIGLATVRTHGAAGTFVGLGDDLNALDVQERIVPEPASIALLSVGGLLLSRRRRDAN